MKLTEEHMREVEENLNLIDGAVNKYFRTLVDIYGYEDLYQAGYIGLHRAVATKDKYKNLTTWAYMNIRWEVSEHMNKANTPLGISIPKNIVHSKLTEERMDEELSDKEREKFYNMNIDSIRRLDEAYRSNGISIDTELNVGSESRDSITLLDTHVTSLTSRISDTEIIAIENMSLQEYRRIIDSLLERYSEHHYGRYNTVKTYIENLDAPMTEISRIVGKGRRSVTNDVNIFKRDFKEKIVYRGMIRVSEEEEKRLLFERKVRQDYRSAKYSFQDLLDKYNIDNEEIKDITNGVRRDFNNVVKEQLEKDGLKLLNRYQNARSSLRIECPVHGVFTTNWKDYSSRKTKCPKCDI